MTKGLFCFSCF